MKKENDFGRDSIPLLVLKISIPFMFAQFVNVLYSIVDRIYIGNIPVIGADSLAGAGVCAPIITLLSSFGTLIGIGGSVLFSVRLGAGDEKSAKQILANSFSMLLIFSGILTIVFLLTKDYLLRWFGASADIFPYANTYMTIYTLGTFFALLSMGMNYFITAQGYPGLGMLTTLQIHRFLLFQRPYRSCQITAFPKAGAKQAVSSSWLHIYHTGSWMWSAFSALACLR